jgi:ABC-type methionine transport system ATPase subunit
VGLSDRADHYPNELSGGQQQRVAIARALVTDPRIIVADEPTGDLDRTTGAEVLTLLHALVRDQGKTIVMVTHDPKAAARAQRLVHLEKGVLVDEVDESPDAAPASNASPAVTAIVGAIADVAAASGESGVANSAPADRGSVA